MDRPMNETERSLPAYVEPVARGVYAIDTGFQRPRFDAAYLIVENGRAAFIDTGTHFAVPRLLGALAALGLARDACDYVIPTHVHLDHAGGVGALMAELPAAIALVHPRGARHMVDPRQLWLGAQAVYGEETMAREYGRATPIAAARVRPTADGMTVELGGRPLVFADTPGHARHHHCIWDAATRGWFTGDTFGIAYPEFRTARGPWLMPATTPVQFEPEALRASVERLLSFEPQAMYLTHYGRLDDPARYARQLLALQDELVALGLRERGAADRHQALRRGLHALFTASLREHGCTLAEAELIALLELDIELDAQGIASWLDRPAAAT